jgi:hypothetical protein
MSATETHTARGGIGPHERIWCDTDGYPCACNGKEHTLDDLRVLVMEWPRPAQRRILAFALALPPEAVNAAGTRLYVANQVGGNLTVFTLDASGNVTGQQAGSPFATGGAQPFGVAVR